MSGEYVKVYGTQLLNRQYDHPSVGMNIEDKTWPSIRYICNHMWSTDSQILQGSQIRSSSWRVRSWQVQPKEAHTLTTPWSLTIHWYVMIVRAECVTWCQWRYLTTHRWQPLDTWQPSGQNVSRDVRKGTWRPIDMWGPSGRSVSHGVREGTWRPLGP